MSCHRRRGIQRKHLGSLWLPAIINGVSLNECSEIVAFASAENFVAKTEL